MARAILLTGGNEGDVAVALASAREMLSARAGAVVAASQIYRSAPWGDMEAGAEDFLDQALILETPLTPEELLDTTQQIERELGRVRGEAATTTPQCRRTYSSRPIDIDILFYDNLVYESPRLTIPHPLIKEREFVLEPLADIAPDLRHPVSGLTVSEMLRALRAGRTRR